MRRPPQLAWLALVVAIGCGGEPASDWSRFEDQCTRFCENGFDCVGDPEGRRANCRSGCTGGTPISRACEEAAVVWATCLADLTCGQLLEPDFHETYCGRERAAYQGMCVRASDGGAE